MKFGPIGVFFTIISGSGRGREGPVGVKPSNKIRIIMIQSCRDVVQ